MQFLSLTLTFLAALTVEAVFYRRFQVVAPLANTIWLTGKTVPITWQNITPTGIPFPTYSNINLRRLGDSTFNVNIATNISSSLYNYNWKVPANLANQDDYYVRIFPIRNEGEWLYNGTLLKPIISANSAPFVTVGGAGDFSKNTDALLIDIVNQLAFLQPVAGNVWSGGETKYIQWTFQQATPDALISILLENDRWLSTPLVVASQINAIPGVANIVGFKWVVPTTLRSSTQYKLRIVAQYTGADDKPPVSSISPAFTISQT